MTTYEVTFFNGKLELLYSYEVCSRRNETHYAAQQQQQLRPIERLCKNNLYRLLHKTQVPSSSVPPPVAALGSSAGGSRGHIMHSVTAPLHV
jgi:hypothetical protein